MIQLHKICGCEVVEEKKACVEKNGTAYDVTFMRMTADHWKRSGTTKIRTYCISIKFLYADLCLHKRL